MTVSSTVNKTQANGNGSTSAFPFTFKFTASSEIEVYVDDTLKTLSTHYTLSLPGDSGTVTFLTAPTDFRPQTGEVVTIRRIQPLTQTFDPTAGGGLSSSSVEGSDDNLLMKIQQVSEEVSRAPKLKDTTETGELTFPEPSASDLIAWNAAGTALVNVAAADVDITAVTPFIATLFDDATAAEARTTLGAIGGSTGVTDNAVIRASGTGGATVDSTGVTIDDSNNVAGVVNLTQTGYTDLTEIAEPSSPAANVARLYAVDDGLGITRLRMKDSSGRTSSLGREVLHAARTYYVRTDGSDSNTGLVDSAGGAFLTIQKAINTIYSLDLSAFNVDIEVRDGTYTGTIALSGPWLGTGAVSLNGQSASGTIISTTSANCISGSDGARLTITDLELRTTTGGKCLFADTSSVFLFSGLRFGACAAHHIEASNSGVINASGNYSIVGSAVSHLHAPFGGFINISGVTVTLSGTPAFSGFFAGVSGPSNITAVSTTFSGSATGVRYIVYKSGHIETGGGNPASYFPGNAAGALGSGGTIDLLPMVDTAYTVANLPAAALFAGARALVVDANATTFASVVAGGGANIVPVFSSGSAWVIG